MWKKEVLVKTWQGKIEWNLIWLVYRTFLLLIFNREQTLLLQNLNNRITTVKALNLLIEKFNFQYKTSHTQPFDSLQVTVLSKGIASHRHYRSVKHRQIIRAHTDITHAFGFKAAKRYSILKITRIYFPHQSHKNPTWMTRVPRFYKEICKNPNRIKKSQTWS